MVPADPLFFDDLLDQFGLFGVVPIFESLLFDLRLESGLDGKLGLLFAVQLLSLSHLLLVHCVEGLEAARLRLFGLTFSGAVWLLSPTNLLLGFILVIHRHLGLGPVLPFDDPR